MTGVGVEARKASSAKGPCLWPGLPTTLHEEAAAPPGVCRSPLKYRSRSSEGVRNASPLVGRSVPRHPSILSGAAAASAQDDTDPSGHSCVGTWLLRVTPLGEPASSGFPVSATFEADGSFIVTGYVASPGQADAPDAPTFLSPGLGVWEATDAGACAVTHLVYIADAQGNPLNTLEIRLMEVVGPDGNTMTGTDYATVMAPDGTMLFEGPGNTVEGTRFVLQLPPASSPSPAP